MDSHRLLCPWNFPSKNTRVGCYFLLQGIFPGQEWNPRLLHWQADSLPLSHQTSISRGLGSLTFLVWKPRWQSSCQLMCCRLSRQERENKHHFYFVTFVYWEYKYGDYSPQILFFHFVKKPHREWFGPLICLANKLMLETFLQWLRLEILLGKNCLC